MRHPNYPLSLSIIAAFSLLLSSITLVQAAPIPAPLQSTTAWDGPHYLTVPAAAFHPKGDDYDYENHGRYLKHYGFFVDPHADGDYYAPLQLPQGARITKLTYFWKDTGPGYTYAQIFRRNRITDVVEGIAGSGNSSDTWTPGFGYSENSVTSFAIDEPINNLLYTYYLRIVLPAGDNVWGCAVQIEYDTNPAVSDPGRLVIPPAGFLPFKDGHSYFNFGWKLDHYMGPSSLSGRGWYVAQVNLPDGATVTGLTFYWKRNGTTSSNWKVYLQRSLLSFGNYENMAQMSGGAGSGSLVSSNFTNSITNPLVSNLYFTYWITLDLPEFSDIYEAREVLIDYSLPSSSDKMISVSTAAFQPYEDEYQYENSGGMIQHYYGPGGSSTNGWYLAPLSLPDGVRITSMKFHWFENTTIPGVARLQRTTLNQGNYEELATAWTSTGQNKGSVSIDDTITGGPVDNRHYAYWLVVDIPSNAFLTNVVIPYSVKLTYSSYNIYLPIVQR